jgi:hypothetical protein
MTDNQKFTAFQKSIRKSRYAHQTPIPFETKCTLHVWTNKSDAASHTSLEFTMHPGQKAVDAGKIADAMATVHFGMTTKQMEYTDMCSQLDITCAATGKKLKV